jgi:hypothetical protein
MLGNVILLLLQGGFDIKMRLKGVSGFLYLAPKKCTISGR